MTGLVLILAAALSAGNAEFDRAAAEGAAEIAAARFKKALVERGAAEGVLKAAQLADPAAHGSRAASEKACREIYAEAARKAFADEAAALRARLNLADDFRLELGAAELDAVMARFPAAFDAERRAAVEEQARGIASATRPTEAEVEDLSDGELRDLMTDRIAKEQKTPVFEENRAYISDRIVAPVIEGARRERDRQAAYLMTRARSEAAAPSVLAKDLEARLRNNVAERSKSVPPQDAWGLFPSVLSRELPAAVERRTVDRLTASVEGVKFEVSADEVLRQISADPAGHAQVAESERRFALAYASRALAEALEKAVAEAPEGERGELGDWLRGHLQDAAPVKAADRLVKRDVMPQWRKARAEAAERIAAAAWPTLLDGTWYPAAELADETVARSDYAAAVAAWRESPALADLAKAAGDGPVVEEAALKADAAVARAFDLARSAVAAQNAIVDGCHHEVLAESRARKDSFWRQTPDLKAVTDLLTGAVEKRWSERRVATLWPDGKTPANAAEQHASLFPSVKRKIELLAKVILEEMNEPRPEEEKKPEEPPPEEKPEDPPPEEPPEELLEFSLSVRRSGDEIELRLEQGGKSLLEERVGAKADDFENAMYRVTKTLSREALRLK